MKRSSLFFSVVAVLGSSLVARQASATPTFPDVVQSTLSLQHAPECSLCHLNGVTGLGTVQTPFGKTMLARGVKPNDEASLRTALQAIIAEKKDSDGDGVSDVDALKAGKDPNGASAAGADGGATKPAGTAPIEYGCARVAPKETTSSFALSMMLVSALAALVRRRSR